MSRRSRSSTAGAWTPEATLNTLVRRARSGLENRRIVAARSLLKDWSEIALDGNDRRQLGDPLWARKPIESSGVLGNTDCGERLLIECGHCTLRGPSASTPRRVFRWSGQGRRAALATPTVIFRPATAARTLAAAIVCYTAYLRVHTANDAPSDWAGTQNNLGNAYSQMPIGDRAENLRRAIACYEAASQ